MVSEINLTPTASFVQIANGAAINPNDLTKAAAIPARTWGTPSECVAGALLVHGLGAHSGWFEALGRRLKVRRVFSLAYDMVGFGKRRQERLESREQWFSDLVAAYRRTEEMVGDKPVFILGNSMGAAVALKVVSDRTITPPGLAMFSPGFDGNPKIFTLLYRLSAISRAFMNPEQDIALPYTPDMVTRTESVVNFITNDPDRRFSPSGQMLIEVLKLSFDIARVKAVPCPILMLGAGIDKIVDTKVSLRIFNRVQAPQKTQHVYQEAWHDLMFDPVLDDLSDEVTSWMKSVSLVGNQNVSAAN